MVKWMVNLKGWKWDSVDVGGGFVYWRRGCIIVSTYINEYLVVFGFVTLEHVRRPT